MHVHIVQVMFINAEINLPVLVINKCCNFVNFIILENIPRSLK